MPDTNQPKLALALTPYINRGLFADNFLENRLPELPEWQEAEGLVDAFACVLELYRDRAARFTKKTNESQTEDDFIKPVLDVLWRQQQPRDCYQVQVRIPNLDADRQPDYALFRCAADRTAADPQLGTIEYWRDVPCLGDAKKWTASLDKERGADENPTAQICNYLYRSRVRWGILTNGRHWRLYEREKSYAGGIYFDVDLEGILEHSDRNAFKYFYHFFRREAFLPDQNGVTFLERVFQGSVEYAATVGERLKESVYDALRLLMNGFYEFSGNGLDRHDAETLNLVHENALIVLYRLLFLLYAEDRRLLAREVEPYASNSLYRLHKEINEYLRAGRIYAPVARRFWGELTSLFNLIDRGYLEGGIPAYNGGLFSPSRYPHIAYTARPGATRWEIGDGFLAQAIDMLAYQRDSWNEPGSHDVDYATLAVQHLGSIYEGLLELRPHVADEPLAETLEDGKPVFKPLSSLPARPEGRAGGRLIRGQSPREVNRDEVYLITDRGERKATGSYYTPKYIVDYIVENTIGPLAEAAAKKVAELSRQATAQIERLARKRRQFEQEAKKGNGRTAARGVASIDEQIEAEKRRLLEPYLSLKILDPAMGSGHFLVGAADFLSLAMATDPNLPHGLAGEEDPQGYYKRLVVERCLYGVDLNPLAVELAKLSLWLHTVSKDKSLSFLDHHLRCGNSLIGARIEEDLVREPPVFNAHGRRMNVERAPLFARFDAIFTLASLQGFLDTFRQIVESRGGSAEAERRKDELYRIMDAQRQKFRAVAACWLAPYFGVPVTAAQYEQAVHALRGSPADWESLGQEPWFQAAQKVAEEQRFFHWELEYPEAFFKRSGIRAKEERGFDAVIGNPPYDELSEHAAGRELPEKRYFRDEPLYLDALGGRLNIFRLFVVRSMYLVRDGGMHSFIVPMALLGDQFTSALRRRLLNEGWLRSICAFPQKDDPHNRVFFDAKLSTCIYVADKRADPQCNMVVKTYPGKSFEDKPKECLVTVAELRELDPDGLSIPAIDQTDLLRWKMVHLQPRVARFGDVAKCYLGELMTNSSNAHLTSDKPVGPRLLRGANINYYVLLEEPKQGEPLYLREAEFLEEYATDIRSTHSRGVRIGFQESSPIDNWRRLIGCVIPPGYYCVHKIRYFAPDAKYDLFTLLAVFNSDLPEWRFGLTSTNNSINAYEVDALPIPRFTRIGLAESERPPVDWKRWETILKPKESGVVKWEQAVLTEMRNTPSEATNWPDAIHDAIAAAGQELSRLGEERQRLTNEFAGWLIEKLQIDEDRFSGLTYIRGGQATFDQMGWESFRDLLRRNHRACGVDLARCVKHVEKEHADTSEQVQENRARFSALDAAIDRVLWQLVGLKADGSLPD